MEILNRPSKQCFLPARIFLCYETRQIHSADNQSVSVDLAEPLPGDMVKGMGMALAHRLILSPASRSNAVSRRHCEVIRARRAPATRQCAALFCVRCRRS